MHSKVNTVHVCVYVWVCGCGYHFSLFFSSAYRHMQNTTSRVSPLAFRCACVHTAVQSALYHCLSHCSRLGTQTDVHDRIRHQRFQPFNHRI